MSLVQLKPAHQCSNDDRYESVTERHVAEAILRGYRGDSVAMHRLRELLASTDQNVFRHDDYTVLAIATVKMVKGELRARKDPCERKNEKNRIYCDWIRKYKPYAFAVAGDLMTSVQNILGLSAFESDFGRNRAAILGNNFFNLTTTKDKPLPGQIGMMVSFADPNVVVCKFVDFIGSARAFAQTKGQLILGETDAKVFATILQTRGQFGLSVRKPLPNWVDDLGKVIQQMAMRLNCY